MKNTLLSLLCLLFCLSLSAQNNLTSETGAGSINKGAAYLELSAIPTALIMSNSGHFFAEYDIYISNEWTWGAGIYAFASPLVPAKDKNPFLGAGPYTNLKWDFAKTQNTLFFAEFGAGVAGDESLVNKKVNEQGMFALCKYGLGFNRLFKNPDIAFSAEFTFLGREGLVQGQDFDTGYLIYSGVQGMGIQLGITWFFKKDQNSK